MAKQQSIGALEAAVAGVKAVAPGLSLGKILSDIGTEMKEVVAHGAHELAAVLNTGSSFVMYPRGQHEDQQHGLPQQAQSDEPQQERGGREM